MSTSTPPPSKLSTFTSLFFVTILGILVAKLMWLIITPTQQLSIVKNNTADITIHSKEKINYGKLIANQHIFGTVEVKKAPATAPVKSNITTQTNTTTKLNLTLHGIVSYLSSNGGFALISSANGPQKVYGIGDSIQKLVTISKILPDRVILDHNGNSEELLLPKNKSSNSDKVSSYLPRTKNTSTPSRWKNPSNVDINFIRREALVNPQRLLLIASPSPAIINGRFIGFRVQPGRKRKLFRQLGLRSNDIITEVNGITLDDASKGAMVLGQLSQATDLSVTVLRGSQQISLPPLQF